MLPMHHLWWHFHQQTIAISTVFIFKFLESYKALYYLKNKRLLMYSQLWWIDDIEHDSSATQPVSIISSNINLWLVIKWRIMLSDWKRNNMLCRPYLQVSSCMQYGNFPFSLSKVIHVSMFLSSPMWKMNARLSGNVDVERHLRQLCYLV